MICKMNITELTEKEKKEAVEFMESISHLSYDEFEEYKKTKSWRFNKLLNWCRIRKDYPELNTIWDTKFRWPALRLKQQKAWEEIKKKMAILKNKFITDNLIEDSFENVKYRKVHHGFANNDEYLIMAIPFCWSNPNLVKFGWWICLWKSECPWLFEHFMKNNEKFDWSADYQSKAEKYNKY